MVTVKINTLIFIMLLATIQKSCSSAEQKEESAKIEESIAVSGYPSKIHYQFGETLHFFLTSSESKD